MSLVKRLVLTILMTYIFGFTLVAPVWAFTFASMGDSQNGPSALLKVSQQISSLNPNFVIHNGDLESDGVNSTEMNEKTQSLITAGLFGKTFLIRGNHDDHVSGSSGLWQSYLTTKYGSTRSLPSGVTNYVGMNSSSTYLTYSFDYENSRFIGIDVPGCSSLISSAQYTFLNDRLSNAESSGLTHAFLFWHGPEYYMESTHPCSYPSALVSLINKHPIVSATFHGHSHILGWTHLDSSRVSGLTHPYEQFMTSPAGGYLSYYKYLVSGRMDYVYPLGTGANDMGFGTIDVSGASFTFKLYKLGTSTPLWSKTFTKSGTVVPTATPGSASPTPTRTLTPTPTRTLTPTPTRTLTPTRIPTGTSGQLVISSVQATSITTTTAVISWSLSDYGTGQVEYGTTTGYGSFSTPETSLNWNHHSLTISNLNPGTQYHFRVISGNGNGIVRSGDNTFTTLGSTVTLVPTSTVLVGDANGDGVVNEIDYNNYWWPHYSQTLNGGPAVGDFNNDGRVDGVDYSLWLNNVQSVWYPTPTKTPTRTATLTPTKIATITPTRMPTATTKPNPTATPGGNGSRPLKYYLVDRVQNYTTDFPKLASWGINTAIVNFDVNGNSSTWRTIFTEAAKNNINIVIWPSDYNKPRGSDCNWEAPYPENAGGDISHVTNLLDVASQYTNFIGIVSAHESFWSCKDMSFDEMAGLKTKLKAYAASKGRSIKVWNYINGIYYESLFPASQVSRIMDVAVIWKHCAGSVEGSCNGSSGSAISQIKNDRARLNSLGLDKTVELVYLMQTFQSTAVYNGKNYMTRFTLSELENYSCEFLNTSALDGFGFYTWHAWWTDLHSWSDLQPAVPYVYNNCVNK